MTTIHIKPRQSGACYAYAKNMMHILCESLADSCSVYFRTGAHLPREVEILKELFVPLTRYELVIEVKVSKRNPEMSIYSVSLKNIL